MQLAISLLLDSSATFANINAQRLVFLSVSEKSKSYLNDITFKISSHAMANTAHEHDEVLPALIEVRITPFIQKRFKNAWGGYGARAVRAPPAHPFRHNEAAHLEEQIHFKGAGIRCSLTGCIT